MVNQGLVQIGDDLGARGQDAVLRDKPGGGNQAVDRIELQGHVHLIDLVNNAAADIGALEGPVDVASGGGGLHAALDVVQEAIEL